MQLIRKTAYARAGLVGNPSDGYNGKTISVIVKDFSARVTMYEWDQLEIVWSQEDRSRFRSVRELAQDVRQHGYYGGIRLVKAAIKKFAKEQRPGLRVSADYLAALNVKVAEQIRADVRINGSRKTLRGSVIRYADGVNKLARPGRRSVR